MNRLWIPAIMFTASMACGDTPAPEKTEAMAKTEAPAKADAHGEHEGHDDHGKVEVAFDAAPEGAKVFFVSPADGATVTSPVKVVFGIEGATLKPAGVPEVGTGHHHVIVDGEPVPAGKAVPADETHIHFGKAQTEAELELSAGEHTLTLQLADGLHRSYGPDLTQTITVTVGE